jgi:CII-binding regulator of phage lambda lysogenization HflD
MIPNLEQQLFETNSAVRRLETRVDRLEAKLHHLADVQAELRSEVSSMMLEEEDG